MSSRRPSISTKAKLCATSSAGSRNRLLEDKLTVDHGLLEAGSAAIDKRQHAKKAEAVVDLHDGGARKRLRMG